MISFRIVPLDTPTAQRLRATRVDEQGNRLLPRPTCANDAYPCRHCLRDSVEGEAMLLAAYSPFKQANPYKEVGPIFVHADDCSRYEATDRVPEQLRCRLLALRGYDAQQRLVGGEIVQGQAVEGYLDELLAKPEVAFVHVRYARAGCFACLIERV